MTVDRTPSQLAIEAKGLTKTFQNQSKPSVDGLSLEIRPGESVAFLGPNGAGKSTTIKMLCGILKPNSGYAKILGFEAGKPEANLRLGLVFGARSQLYFHMNVEHSLRLQAETYFVEPSLQAKRIAELTEIFGASHLLKRRVRELSLGERMRCELVASLIHAPQVILLDEPTIGLDVTAKHKLRESLRTWQKRENTTLLLTSHDLADVEALCSRCILINEGVKAYDGPLNEVKGPLQTIRRVHLTLKESQIDSSAEADSLQPAKRGVLFENHPHLTAHVKEKPTDDPLSRFFEFDLKSISVGEVLKWISDEYSTQIDDIKLGDVTLEEVIRIQNQTASRTHQNAFK
jgi:ABC-2 type transport system ATP-binding protein